MSNLPPMPVRAFRDYFMIGDAVRDEDGDHEPTPSKDDRDPYERCDFEEED